ncbi:MAG TPA: carboxypeptidase-like regulatory domain-containing protein, partial [Acidobacteriaceae bacterium]|nr:carboxypeptidase-like regulatory domain-containing protein [Acidobacteriaceae bacterium]
MKPCLNRIAPILLCIICICPTCPSPALGQAPQPISPSPPSAEPLRTSQLTGTITDTQGATVSGATLTLTPLGKLDEHTATSAADGSFTFTNLPASVYHLTVQAEGLALYTSGEITLRSGASLTLPAIALKEATFTSIRVVASPDQIALAQIHLEEQQRVLGIFQNFYTSYIWDAKPMPVKQKFRIAFKSLYDPPQFLIVAGIAGAEQYEGTYPGYGPGIEGYGKRYGAQLATSVDDRIIGSAILPSLLHQDPRYFYQGSGSVPSRSFHAVAHTFTARGDNGKTEPNYSHLLGELAAAGIS